MNRKFLAHRTVAPRLSELFNEAYDLLKAATPGVKNFTVLIHDNGEEIQTRIIPMMNEHMADIFEASESSVKYVAHTDENSNFIKGEEK